MRVSAHSAEGTPSARLYSHMALSPLPTTPPDLHRPSYGESTLAELGQSLLGAVCPVESNNPLSLASVQGSTIILLIDGLGAESLETRRHLAPDLIGALHGTLTSCLPSTTATSLTSLATGEPPSHHAMMGYTQCVDGRHPMNMLRWEWIGPRSDALLLPSAHDVQPLPTIYERLAKRGIVSHAVGPSIFETTPFTHSTLRGTVYHGADGIDPLIVTTRLLASAGDHTLIYCYWSGLDGAAHDHGVGSHKWCEALVAANGLFASIRDSLPSGCLLVSTGDHGGMTLSTAQRHDVAATPDLLSGVAVMAGEVRFRYLTCHEGAAPDVIATWKALLGHDAHVMASSQALEEGWFGPTPVNACHQRAGDVIVISRGHAGVGDSVREGQELAMLGHHGSATTAETSIPLLWVET